MDDEIDEKAIPTGSDDIAEGFKLSPANDGNEEMGSSHEDDSMVVEESIQEHEIETGDNETNQVIESNGKCFAFRHFEQSINDKRIECFCCLQISRQIRQLWIRMSTNWIRLLFTVQTCLVM